MITSNHDVILGDQPRKIEIDENGTVVSGFEKEFKIEGRDSGASSMIFITVRGLVGDADPIDVDINGRSVGRLMPNPEASPESWFTQMLHFSTSEGSLNPNDRTEETINTIQIPGKKSLLKPSKFYVQNIVVLYKAIFDQT